MKCPSCTDSVLVMSERNNIEIDYCPSCRGVWLDRGELDKILANAKLSSVHEEVQRPDQYREPSYPHSSYGKYPKRKKSFLEEIFD